MFPFRRRNKEKPRDPLPAWVKWAVMAFIGYAIITNPNRGKPLEHAAEPVASTPTVRGVASEKVAQYKNMLSNFGVALRAEDVAAGNGRPLLCGQEISVNYEAFLGDEKKPIDANKSYSFRLGEGTAMQALEQGVAGMNVGGKRSILARNSLAYGDTRKDIAKDATLRFNVEVLSAEPDITKFESTPFRIAEVNFGGGSAVACGQLVKIMATVWSLEGKKLFETKEPVIITPGKSEVALGIEQGIIGMNRGGTRTLIVPPAMQKPMQGGKAVQSFSLPQPQVVIVDVTVN
jgi:FKBP-type peptidyl-prolyl cis-trans isomerase